MRRDDDRGHVRAVLAAFGLSHVDVTALDTADVVPAQLRRTSDFLTHPVFRTHHSETAMLRYLRALSDRDYALDRGMIPLGSCTMKLNATTEMEPVTWPEFANIHPFAPAAQTRGYRKLVGAAGAVAGGGDRLRRGVACSPTPARRVSWPGCWRSGRTTARGATPHRDVCLIPSSAHGTNAASAVMAGMRVVVVACDERRQRRPRSTWTRRSTSTGTALAAIMVTYPSTHGVYETGIADLCAKVHDAGGQVYVDGANLNALVGFAKPGQFGADVSHLNLHKTFCIPHGGGGPGVGPVAVRAHLAAFLPGAPAASRGRAGRRRCRRRRTARPASCRSRGRTCG